MFQEIDNLPKIVEEFISKSMSSLKGIDVYEVTELQESTFTVNIKHPNFKNLIYNNVPITSLGLGNFKGIMKLPSAGDLVVVAFISSSSNYPIVIGTIFNSSKLYSQSIPQIQADELLLVSKPKGSYIILNKDNNIIIRSIDNIGNKKAVVTIKSDNTVEIEADIIKLGDGSQGFARLGDSVEVSDPISGTLVGTITSGSSKVIGGN